MAFNYSNNRDANKPFEPDIYSAYRFNNAESEVDKTCLTTKYWKQMLKIGIYPRKDTGEEISFDMDKGLIAYLSHTKARMLANEIRNFLRDPETYSGSGVATGSGVITISNGLEIGSKNPVMIIRKVDETGNVVSSIAYEFKTDYYFSVRNYAGTTDFSKEVDSYKYMEIECLLTVLDEYVKAMTYAVAYSVLDASKYDNYRMTNRLNAIAEKLGVEFGAKSTKGSSFNNSSSFFNSAPKSSESTGFTSATLDDID